MGNEEAVPVCVLVQCLLQDPGLLSQQSLTPHFTQCSFLVRNWSGSSVMFGLTCACCSWMYQWVLSARSCSCKTQEAARLWCLSGFVRRPPTCVWKPNCSFIRPSPNASQPVTQDLPLWSRLFRAWLRYPAMFSTHIYSRNNVIYPPDVDHHYNT